MKIFGIIWPLVFISICSVFLSECTQNDDCNEPNKGLCQNNTCQCNDDFLQDGDNCVGTLKYKVIQKAIHK